MLSVVDFVCAAHHCRLIFSRCPLIRNILVLVRVDFKEQETFLGSKIINFVGGGGVNIKFIKIQKLIYWSTPHIRNGIIIDPQKCLGLVLLPPYNNQPVFSYKRGRTVVY